MQCVGGLDLLEQHCKRILIYLPGEELMRGRPYLVIENNGDVRWIPPMVLKTVCEHDNQVNHLKKINLGYLTAPVPPSINNHRPIQEESCDLKFGSWVYNAGQLDLRPVE